MKQRKSLSLIEVVMMIVVFAISVPPLLIALSEITAKVAQAELSSSGVILGRALAEEVMSKRFDENPSEPWTVVANLGPDSGESRATYDDFDDFDGVSESSVSGYPGFSYTIDVYYVDPDGSDLDTISASVTDYKRVDVTLSHALLEDMHFTFIGSSVY